MDFEIARANMIEQQIRPWNVLELRTLDALAAVRREDFVPSDYRDIAFADVQIPLGEGEVMLEPKVSARMVESLHLENTDRVLEIGTGTGYLTALLCQLCAHVTSVEIDPELQARARRNLGMAGISNVTLENADGHNGFGEPASFDAILVSGSMARVSDGLTRGLVEGGRLVGIEGYAPAMQAVLYSRTGSGIGRKSLFETSAPRLRNAEDTPEFVF
jgi:protein-L-isoaspartate(D-aspartate) O-methyltransferase